MKKHHPNKEEWQKSINCELTGLFKELKNNLISELLDS